MQLDLTEEEAFVLLNLLIIEAARYPLSPRVQTLRRLLAKFGPLGPAQSSAAGSADAPGT
jgi:hypothetical protein